MTYAEWVQRKKQKCSVDDMVEYLKNTKKKPVTKGSIIRVNDRMQTGYSYKIEKTPAKRASDLWTKVHPKNGKEFKFRPKYLPKDMLILGVFGGKMINDCIDEYPNDWFSEPLKQNKLSPYGVNYTKNKYRIKSGTKLRFWKSKKWIRGDDPRGWFQWYCRYSMGRRHPVDEWQMRRWWNINRFYRRFKKSGGTNVVRQLLLQWSWPQK